MSDGSAVTVRLTVNGREAEVRVHPMSRLLDVLRTDLHLTGTKEGCGEGECGACSVLVNGELVNSASRRFASGGRRRDDDRRNRGGGRAARRAAGVHHARRRAVRESARQEWCSRR